MNSNTLFCHLTSARIAELIRGVKVSVCFAGPGIQLGPANALAEIAGRIGPEMLSVSLDFDENVMRMGYGDLEAVKRLKDAGIIVNHTPGLRSALIIVDDEGFIFTPTPLYLEAESSNDDIRNALRLSRDQVAEALARLSTTAKAIAVAQAVNQEEKSRIENIPVEVSSEQVNDEELSNVEKRLEQAPPIRFDLARQVRVFITYFQYVELKLSGAAIQRRRIAIPPSLLQLDESEELVNRLHTNFDLIENNSRLSSKPLEDILRGIRKNFTPSLGQDLGRVVLKSAKPILTKRLDELREKLGKYKELAKKELQDYLDNSQEKIVDYYLPIVQKSPPDGLLGQSLNSEDEIRSWIESELKGLFPTADLLVGEMKLDEQYKDVTYETLSGDGFIALIENAFPNVDWEKAYSEFKAAAEDENE